MSAAARILITITADSSGVVKGAESASRALGGVDAAAKRTGATLSSRLTSAGQTADRMGRTLTRTVTLPTIAASAASIKMAMDFDTALTQISALVGASQKDMALYRREILKLAEETPKAPQELAEALYFVTSSGFSGAKALDVLEASAKAASAGLGETMTVADAVTSAVNAYGEKNLSAAHATDILLAAVREGKVEGEAFSGVIGRVIPIAAEMGIEFDQVAGNLAAMSLSGLDAAEAATALRGILSATLKPGEDAKKAFKEIGTSIDTFRKNVKDKGVLPALMDLKDRVGDNVDMWGRLFPNVRALSGALNLNGRNAEKNVAIMEALAKATGDTDKAFDEASKGKQFQLDQKLNKLRVAAIKLGDDLMPIFMDLAETVADLAEAFTKLDPTLQKWLIGGAIFGGPAMRLAGAGLKLGGWLTGLGGAAAAGGTTAGTAAAGGAAAGMGLSGAAAIVAPLAAGAWGVKTWIDAERGADRVAAAVERYGIASRRTAKIAKEESGTVSGFVVGSLSKAHQQYGALARLMNTGVADAIKTNIKLTRTQRSRLDGVLDTYKKLNINLDENTRTSAKNLLQVGDFDGALRLLRQNLLETGREQGSFSKKSAEAGGKLAEVSTQAELAAGKTRGLSEDLGNVPKNTKPEINLRDHGAKSAASTILNLLGAIDGTVATATVNVVRVGSGTYANKPLLGSSAVGHVVASPMTRLVGEGSYATPFGRGAEAILPLTDAILGKVGAGIAKAAPAGIRAAGGDDSRVTENNFYISGITDVPELAQAITREQEKASLKGGR